MKVGAKVIMLLLSRANSLLSHVHFRPYDVSIPEGRNAERLRRLGWGTITAGLSKAGGLLTAVFSVGLTAHYLGNERFGLWMTITSIITLLSFADLGMSNSLVNSVSEASGKNDDARLHRDISNGFVIMFFVALCIGVAIGLLYPFVNWASVINVTQPLAIAEAGPALAIYVTMFLISLPLSVVQRVQIGLQEGWRANLWQFVGQLAALAGLLTVVRFNGGVPYLVLAVGGLPVVATAANFVHYFFRTNPRIRPSLSMLDPFTSKRLANVSLFFLVMQLTALIGNGADNIIVGQILGASAVAPFAVAQKLAMVLGISQLFISQIWPTFSEALARGDYQWARRALSNCLLASVILGIFSGLIIIVFGAEIITRWASNSQVPSESVLIGFGVSSVLMGVGGSLSVFLNSGRYLRTQTIIFLVSSVLAVALKIVLVVYWQDAAGAVWGGVIGYSIAFVIPALVVIYSKQ